MKEYKYEELKNISEDKIKEEIFYREQIKHLNPKATSLKILKIGNYGFMSGITYVYNINSVYNNEEITVFSSKYNEKIDYYIKIMGESLPIIEYDARK